ncbi:MAG: hypothetical protein AMXMBFR7_51530 [Planctomycetota bacterium]
MSETPKDIQAYQRRCFREYLPSVGLGPSYRFLWGNPVLPVVPLDTARGGVFIIGAYPSARFACLPAPDGGMISDVPVDNNLGPFSEETYFDGARKRSTASSDELNALFLRPLQLARSDCWITDLVKVFLFKDGHVDRYRRLGAKTLPPANRDKFEEYATKPQPWLAEELALARPRLVITLGAEVAGILRGVTGAKDRANLLSGEVTDLTMGEVTAPAAHLAHPGILMRDTKNNPWPKRHEEHIQRVKTFLRTSRG